MFARSGGRRFGSAQKEGGSEWAMTANGAGPSLWVAPPFIPISRAKKETDRMQTGDAIRDGLHTRRKDKIDSGRRT